MGGFAGHHLAEAPQRGPGKLPAALRLEDLCALGDKPNTIRWYGVGVRHPLSQSQRARRHPLRVGCHLIGGCLQSMAVLRDEVNHAGERCALRQPLEERLPRLATLNLDAHRCYSRLGQINRLIPGSVRTRQDHSLVLRRQLIGQHRGRPAVVRRKDPDAVRLADLFRSARHDHATIRVSAGVGLVEP